jgi:hypothetical protein
VKQLLKRKVAKATGMAGIFVFSLHEQGLVAAFLDLLSP